MSGFARPSESLRHISRPAGDRRHEDSTMRTLRIYFLMTVACLLATKAPSAHAVATAQQLCEAAVEKASGQFGACRLKAESVFTKTGDSAKRSDALAKCSSKLSSGFYKALARYGAAACPAATVGAFETHLAECSDRTVAAVNGADSFASCGDGVVDLPGELCDGEDLDGNSCASLGFLGGTLTCTDTCGLDTRGCSSRGVPATGQTTCFDTAGATIACAGTGQDGADQAGTARTYADNGDGTITDVATGLQWEKLDDAGGLHDKDTLYDETAALAHVAALNAAGFAGHADWRIPNVKELLTLVDYGQREPAVSSAFSSACTPGCSSTTCSCTGAFDFFRSSTIWPVTTSQIYAVSARDGTHLHEPRDAGFYLRLVRGGDA